MAHPIVKVQDGPLALHTLLGQGPARIPTGGKIRPGIMVLTRRAAEQAEAQAIYTRGVAEGRSFEDIERMLAKTLPQLKSPLVPRNVPWFTVRASDFPNPEIAAQILDAYGEDRGQGHHLYRFPVVFPSDHWQTVMPHELAAWSTHEKRFWSQYGPDGLVRHCMHHAPVPMDATGRRTIRIFGGRKAVVREENGGLCDPESCPEYQARQCNLTGRFLFFIPGIRSLSALELPTTSFYAMSNAIQRFQAVAQMRGGRISGFLGRDRTTFFLTKVLKDVPHIDEQGRAVRMPQWIIELEAPVDVTALLRDHEDEEAVIQQARLATQVLEGDEPGAHYSTETARHDCDVVEADARGGDGLPLDEAVVRPGSPTLEQLLVRVQAMGLTPERYKSYADRRWGRGWRINPHGRGRAWDELERYRNDPRGYVDKIETELRVTATTAR
ncbi:recombination directionality factor [Burkholderia vietnamiensis]|uniref:recombination directionality factor n=1 Tax=Burkholderia vietnamiensis TaxID=60552 RepID=UPI001D151C82|nr:hypothetical protein [Burkholderia vietnamiensis]UEC01695.1 hypothetical protein LK462_06615 [Burkholderia vietnamiensis]